LLLWLLLELLLLLLKVLREQVRYRGLAERHQLCWWPQGNGCFVVQ
jgi:hypothetical protein